MEKVPEMKNASSEDVLEEKFIESSKKGGELLDELLKLYGSIGAKEFIEKVLEYAKQKDETNRLFEELKKQK